jgi:hypothetical protein
MILTHLCCSSVHVVSKWTELKCVTERASTNSYTFGTFSTVRSCNHKPRHLKNEFTEAGYALCFDGKAMNNVEKRIEGCCIETDVEVNHKEEACPWFTWKNQGRYVMSLINSPVLYTHISASVLQAGTGLQLLEDLEQCLRSPQLYMRRYTWFHGPMCKGKH